MSAALDKMVQEIMAEGEAKAEQLKKRAFHEVEETLARESDEAVRDADRVIRSAKSEAEAERNRRVSQAKQEARLAYLAEKNRLVQTVLEDVRSTIARFADNDPAYRDFLVKSIARGVEAVPSERVRIALSARDLARFNGEKLVEEALRTVPGNRKVTLRDEPIERTGGALITSDDGKMVADCTIEARLRLLEPQLLAEISKTLFVS